MHNRSTTNELTQKIGIIAITVGWLFLWFAPWQSWLQSYIWLRMGIALAIFITPGVLIFQLLNKGANNLSTALTHGFVISHLLLALLGTLGRMAHIPFTFLLHITMLLGLIFLLISIIPTIVRYSKSATKIIGFCDLLSFWPLVLLAILTALITLQRTITYDDFAYLAYLTNWQHAASLDFNDVFFGIDQVTIKRFFIVSTPYNQAFLASISGLHGLFIIGGFYEPFLAILACISVYNLSRTLGFSKNASIAALGLQIAFLVLLSDYLHPGFPFFNQLSTDKASAAYIFVPVFIQSALLYFDSPNWKNLGLFALAAMSLSFMHPGILAFAIAISGLVFLFRLSSQDKKVSFFFFGVLLLTLIPQIIIRFINIGNQPSYSFSAESLNSLQSLVTVLDGTIFYGFNLSNLDMQFPHQGHIPFPDTFLKYIWILIPLLASAFAIPKLKKSNSARYILASFILVAFAGVPFTGWILGYFLSALMLERTTWLFPYGIGTIFLVKTIIEKINLSFRLEKRARKFYQLAYSTLTALSIGSLLLFMQYNGLPDFKRIQVNTGRYTELAQIGNYFDEHITDQSIVVGTEKINDMIPGLSANAKVISFWFRDPFYSYYFTEDERYSRNEDQLEILSNNSSPEDRFALIRKYNVKYLLLQSGKLHLLNPLISAYPSNFQFTQIGRYLIVKVDS